MSKTAMLAKQQMKDVITSAIEKAIKEGALPQGDIPEFIIETPADKTNGDLATNAAMVSAKAFRMPPFKIAQAIKENISLEGTLFTKFETAGPGFINFFLSPTYYARVLKEVEQEKDDFGKSNFGNGEKVMVEFVSANPTGPMHMGNARGGALGDCLASVLEKAGYDVWREFYVNDAGNQIEKFACSLEARYLQIYDSTVPFPEDGYQGEDIKDLANLYNDENGDKLLSVTSEERKQALVDFALPRNISKMQADMAKYKITYDKWFFESELHNSGAVKEVVDILTEKGLTYEKEGAVWYKNAQVVTEKLLAQGKKYVYLSMLTASVVTNILCNMVTIPLWGKMGAALASVISYAVAGGCFLVYYLKSYNIPARDVFLFTKEERVWIAGKVKAVKRRLMK